LTDFLIFLLEEKQFSLSTIKGYRAAITFVLGRQDNVFEEDIFRELFRGFEQAVHIRTGRQLPQWDLPVVLEHLSSNDYVHPSDLR
jgi:hypothetical protein